jgi:predicted nucleic acid-binding protein
MTRFSLDSNILVYAADMASPPHQASAQQIVDASAERDCVLTTQAIAEFFHATTRKRLAKRMHATRLVRDWTRLFQVAGPGAAELLAAVDASNDGRFQFFDALLLATAGAAGCTAVISEDMHPGATLGGVRVMAAFDPAGGIAADARGLLGL